jgi:hypothetical protein
MEQSSITQLRWLFVPFAAALGFLASIVLAGPLNMLIHYVLWSNGYAMPGKMFLMYALPYDGALAASLVIQFGTYAAPKRKKLAALCLFIGGCVLAWSLVGEFYSPEALITNGVRHGPVRVWWPLIGTVMGGLLTLGWIWLTSPKSA